jgi:hypothetical protein
MIRRLKALFLLFGLAEIGFCQRPQTAAIVADKDTLRGHAAMAVAIDTTTNPSADLRPDIESRLRAGGITVLRQTPDPLTYPLLRVSIGGVTVQRVQQLNYHITLEFIQLFPSGDGTYLKATTWSSNHYGLTPWTGAFSAPQAETEIERDLMSLIGGFVDAWREANGQARPQAGPAPVFSGRFNGTWQGTYSCSRGSSGGQTVWVIREVKAGSVEVQEQWTHFISGRNNYSGTIAGNNLDVKTKDMGGYEVKLTLSDDNRTLRGQYIGHPNYCETIVLRKSQ